MLEAGTVCRVLIGSWTLRPDSIGSPQRRDSSVNRGQIQPSNLPHLDPLQPPRTPHLRLSGARGGEFVHRKAAFTGNVL